MHAAMRPMARRPAPVDPAPMRCGGCGAKLPPAVLARVLARLPRGGGSARPCRTGRCGAAAPARRGATDGADRGHVPRLRGRPWLFGRIAANHALGDLAAMGATPRAALAIAALPPAAEAVLEADLLAMLRGAQDVLAAAGAELVGGHSAEGLEPMLGFALTGEVTEGRALRRADLRPGDVLVLTKGLGTGALLAAAMQGGGRAAWTEAAYEAMQRTPFPAARILGAHGATACTDVTGFGLLNHLAEMLEASGVAAALDPHAVPALAGAAEVLAAGARSTLHPANAAAAGPRLGGAGRRCRPRSWACCSTRRRRGCWRACRPRQPRTASPRCAGAAIRTPRRSAWSGPACRASAQNPAPAADVRGWSGQPGRRRNDHAEHRGNHPAGPGKPVPAAGCPWPRQGVRTRSPCAARAAGSAGARRPARAGGV
ncbi:selenide, water dikinase SelD [Siccirubricoccus deserti]